MVVDLPEFNIPPGQAEWDKRTKGFHARMTRCVRREGISNIPPNLNILRLSICFEESKQVESWNGIRTFLDVSGYDTRDTQMTEPREADMLFISTDSDRFGDAKYIIDMIAQGFLGLIPRDDMLVSGPGIPGSSPYNAPINQPLLLSTDFTGYGACLIHGYITTLRDPRALLGRYVTMMLLMEGKLQGSGIASPDTKYAGDKIEAFRALLEKREHVCGEERWVLAVLNLLRHIRNYLSHIPPLQETLDKIEDAIDKIDDLAKEYKRPLWAPRESNIQDLDGAWKRWLTLLTQIAWRWIDEYLQTHPVSGK